MKLAKDYVERAAAQRRRAHRLPGRAPRDLQRDTSGRRACRPHCLVGCTPRRASARSGCPVARSTTLPTTTQDEALTMLPPFVSRAWLEEHADEVFVADVRWYLDGRSGREAHEAGHLPALGLRRPRRVARRARRARPRVATPCPTRSVFAMGMGALGIGDGDDRGRLRRRRRRHRRAPRVDAPRPRPRRCRSRRRPSRLGRRARRGRAGDRAGRDRAPRDFARSRGRSDRLATFDE